MKTKKTTKKMKTTKTKMMKDSATKKTKKKTSDAHARSEVNARDLLVLSCIQHLSLGDAISRVELQEELRKQGHDFSGSFVYLSLYRLHKASEIERVHVKKRAPAWRMAYHVGDGPSQTVTTQPN